jgi:hypothetical protein
MKLSDIFRLLLWIIGTTVAGVACIFAGILLIHLLLKGLNLL